MRVRRSISGFAESARRPALAAAAAACAAGLWAVPVRLTAQDEALDYNAVREAMPAMRELSDKGAELIKKIHEFVEKHDGMQDEQVRRELRGNIRATIAEYRDVKRKMIVTTRPILKLPGTALTDEEVVKKLQETELVGIEWNDAFFDRTIKDFAGALGIPVRLQGKVVKKNQVSMTFARAPAEMILASLCNGFDLRYVVTDGEIVIYKKITPIEDRFLDYQKRHPDVKLRYWEQEDASGDVDKKGGK